MGKRRQDSWGKRARQEGFPARSVYKLEEIDRRTQLFKGGQRVLDLGASPGSWTLFASKRVGPQGRVVALDLNPHGMDDLGSALPGNVDFRIADAREETPQSLGGEFDIVLSDMAPKTTGQRAADQYRSYELFLTAVDIATKVLKPGGHFVGKIFQGAEFEQAREAMRIHFGKTRVIRPKATRDESYELFLVGLRRKATQES